MAANFSRKRFVDSPAIPDRLYFKIGDVAASAPSNHSSFVSGRPSSPSSNPTRAGTGQRLYRRREVEVALEIKRLVHGEGYTLAGARQALEINHRRVEAKPTAAPELSLKSRPESNQAVRRSDSFSATHRQCPLRAARDSLFALAPPAASSTATCAVDLSFTGFWQSVSSLGMGGLDQACADQRICPRTGRLCAGSFQRPSRGPFQGSGGVAVE